MSRVLMIFIGACMLFQCTDSKSIVETQPINNLWHYKHSPIFQVDVSDLDAKDISLIVRNNDEYPYSNIRFIVALQKEKNTPIAIDTLNFMLARPDGSWLGKGFGAVKESELLYKAKYSFPSIGKYSVKVTQAMRKDTLKGIEDIGLKIEPSKP